MGIRKARAIDLISLQIEKFEELLKEANSKETTWTSKYFDKGYQSIYEETEYFLRQIFPAEEVNKFRKDVKYIYSINKGRFSIPIVAAKVLISNPRIGPIIIPIGSVHIYNYAQDKKDNYVEHLKLCILRLKVFKERMRKFWSDDDEYDTQHSNVYLQHWEVKYLEELIMGDQVEGNKPTYSIGDITNSNLSGIVQGEYNTVVASLNAAGQPELAQALTTLTQAVLASQDLPADQKEEQVKVINQIGKEAAEPKPNKTLLKILVDGLLATLKAVPDVANAVTAATPLLSQLHL